MQESNKQKDNWQRPLCVDLDGTLLKTDIFHESLIQYICSNLLNLFRFLFLLVRYRKKSIIKNIVAKESNISLRNIPVNKDVLNFCMSEFRSGRKVVIASGCSEYIVNRLYSKFDFCSEIYTSSDQLNLIGENKAHKLVELYGEKGFDYIGDSKSDLAVWDKAFKSYLVGQEKKFPKVQYEKVFEKPKSSLKTLFYTIRLNRLVKSLSVFAPIFLFNTPESLVKSNFLSLVIASLLLSLLSISLYLINDLFDLEFDRRHLLRRARPVAAGKISIAKTVISSLGLSLFSIASVFLYFKLDVALAFLIFFIVGFLYSYKLKYLAIVDIASKAFLNLSRFYIGCLILGLSLNFEVCLFILLFIASFSCLDTYRILAQNLAVNGTLDNIKNPYGLNDLFFLKSFSVSLLTFSMISLLNVQIVNKWSGAFLLILSLYLFKGILNGKMKSYPLYYIINQRILQSAVVGFVIFFIIKQYVIA
ncbi:UbiA family prenyltransferase [Halobacteriovorax sp. GB3]|uniref:UbiA family prenyltransferase n=1 Tax=Halobacteriovorax sp. GB3 TaxID=2719615 RepID=UPI0023614FD4|nr:UbiA family prenyltransferase [Halobacteriovorax sp. GB3]MDD0852508.1 UbiA family prenyltransferase [Halobacteriovorax sp. GB3]